jgi:hypothetical protein
MKTSTIYQKSIKDLSQYPHDLLKKPTSKKLGAAGAKVLKGRLKGASVFTLTLTERETCPKSCGHWEDCYGNNMPFAHRFSGGPEFEERLFTEIDLKAQKAKAKGEKLLIRLHVLGDFYSKDYVLKWGAKLVKHDNLNVWGYTHVTKQDCPDTWAALLYMRKNFKDRWAVRWSDKPGILFSANSEEIQQPVKGAAIVCPEQEGKTAACTTCALCWDKKDIQIIFKTH